MAYKTQREKIKQYIKEKIIPAIKKQDIDYYKLVDAMKRDLGVSENIIKEEVEMIGRSVGIKEIRIFTISDEKIKPFFESIVSEEKAAERTLREIEEGVKKK